MKVVAFLTRLTNVVVTEDTRFSYDTARVMDGSFFTWAGSGAALVCVQTGWYGIILNSTVLGTGYTNGSGTPAPSTLDFIHAVGRNGITLAATVLSERHVGVTGASAQLMSTGPWPVYLTSGDTLETYYQNMVSGETTILVESNPTDGPNYFTDVGPGTLSPHLIVVKMTGNAP